MSKKSAVTSPKRPFRAAGVGVFGLQGRGLSLIFLVGMGLTGVGEIPPRPVVAAEPPAPRSGIVFAQRPEQELKLDFYPAHERTSDTSSPADNAAAAVKQPPLIVWVHGGAWRRGSRSSVPILDMCQRRYAIASVDYRLSPVAKFPAAVLDIKSAIHFLRERADEYGFDRNRIVVAGASAGGHLAALVGVTCGIKELEPADAKPVRLAAIVSFYGASNLRTILSQSTAHGRSVRVPALNLLLGGQPNELPDLAALASPVEHVTQDDPPIILIHGDADPQMPHQQSGELHYVYEQADLGRIMRSIPGGRHGGEAFYTAEMLQWIDQSLNDFWDRSGDAATIRPRR